MTRYATVSELKKRLDQFSDDLKVLVYVPVGNDQYIILQPEFLGLARRETEEESYLCLAIRTNDVEDPVESVASEEVVV